jgi:hypothetical protein
MQESPHKDSNINLYENKEYNNPNNTNEVDNQNSISTEDNLNKKLNKKQENKYQKFKTTLSKYVGKIAFWKKSKNKNNENKKENENQKQKKLVQKSLNRQLDIYANEQFKKGYGSGLGFNIFI